MAKELGNKNGCRTHSKVILEPSPYMNQACIRGERKRLAIPLRDPRLNETIFWIKAKESLSRESMRKIWLIFLGCPRLASKAIPDTASYVCYVANARTFVSYPANYVAHCLIRGRVIQG